MVADRALYLAVVLLPDQGDVVHAGGAGGVVAAAGVFRAGPGVGVPGDVMRGRGPGVLAVAPDEQDGQVEWVLWSAPLYAESWWSGVTELGILPYLGCIIAPVREQRGTPSRRLEACSALAW